MPKITVLPHAEICPHGAEFETQVRRLGGRALLDHHVAIEHACGKVAACTTCPTALFAKVSIRCPPAGDTEEDLPRRAGS